MFPFYMLYDHFTSARDTIWLYPQNAIPALTVTSRIFKMILVSRSEKREIVLLGSGNNGNIVVHVKIVHESINDTLQLLDINVTATKSPTTSLKNPHTHF